MAEVQARFDLPDSPNPLALGECHHFQLETLALCHEGCSWRDRAIDTLDAAGIDRNIAYLSRSYAGQFSALMADLAIAPFTTGAPQMIVPCTGDRIFGQVQDHEVLATVSGVRSGVGRRIGISSNVSSIL